MRKEYNPYALPYESKVYRYAIYLTFAFTSKQCNACQATVLWEKMFMIVNKARWHGLQTHQYICKQCAPTVQDVVKWRDRQHFEHQRKEAQM